MKCVGTTTGPSRPRPLAMSSPKSRDARNVRHSSSEIAASCFLISIGPSVLASRMQMAIQDGQVASVNVGRPREITVGDAIVRTSIWKDPVAGRIAVRDVNLAGDDQSDRRVHGGDRKAVYAYAREDLDWWGDRLGQRLGSGTFGENLTTEGLDVTAARVGDRWRVGTALLEVTQPRLPCYKLELRMDRPGFIDEFIDGGRPGAYLRIVEEGEVGAGDAIRIISRADDAPSMAEVMRRRTKRSE